MDQSISGIASPDLFILYSIHAIKDTNKCATVPLSQAKVCWKPCLGLVIDVESGILGGQPLQDLLALVQTGKLGVLPSFRVLQVNIRPCKAASYYYPHLHTI